MTRSSVVAAVFVFSVVSICLMGAYSERPIAVLASGLGIILCCAAVIQGVGKAIFSPAYKLVAAIIGALGIFGVFLYEPGFNLDLQAAYSRVILPMGRIEMICGPLPVELMHDQERGVLSCATQSNTDYLSATFELAKGVHLDPVLSIADTAYARTLAPSKNDCAQAFKVLSEWCSSAFYSMPTKYKQALLREADLATDR